MKYLNSINHYRALSIVLIVTLHVYSTADFVMDTFLSRFLFNLISGATLNFVFISGFLFYIVFYQKFDYFQFVKGRVDRYLKPYLILSILPIIIRLISDPMYWDNTIFIQYKENFLLWNLISSLKFLITGAHITAYWYIPFIMLMVLISPLFVKFISLNFKKQLVVFIVLLGISSLVQRPYERLDLFQAVHSVIYFTPIYLMGIMCAIYRDKIYSFLKNKEFYLLAVVLLIVTWQTTQGHVGLYKNVLLGYNGTDLVIIKMLFFCLFFMIFLRRFESNKNKIVSTLAATSFTIFFLHVYFLKLVNVVKSYFNLSFEKYSLLAFFLIAFILILLSVVTAKCIYRLWPKYSYILIGYSKKPYKHPQISPILKLISVRKYD